MEGRKVGAKNPLPSRAQVTIIDVVTDVATTSLDGSHCPRPEPRTD